MCRLTSLSPPTALGLPSPYRSLFFFLLSLSACVINSFSFIQHLKTIGSCIDDACQQYPEQSDLRLRLWTCVHIMADTTISPEKLLDIYSKLSNKPPPPSSSSNASSTTTTPTVHPNGDGTGEPPPLKRPKLTHSVSAPQKKASRPPGTAVSASSSSSHLLQTKLTFHTLPSSSSKRPSDIERRRSRSRSRRCVCNMFLGRNDAFDSPWPTHFLNTVLLLVKQPRILRLPHPPLNLG